MAKKSRDDNKPRGKMSAYAYFLQICREDHKKKHPNEQVNFAEFSKRCAEKWKGLQDKEKKRFHDLAANDKVRYDREMANYVPPEGTQTGKRKRGKKDPNAPKRALSAFFWFCNDERPKVKSINSALSVGEVAKELGKRWGLANQPEKAKYEALAAKDKERYDREIKIFKSGGAAALASKKGPGAGGSRGRGVAVSAAPVQESEDDDDDEEDDDDEDDDE